jgi:hypothetical protein
VSTYEVEWMGIRTFVSAPNRNKAKMRVMRMARNAGYWRPGQSLKGLTCRLAAYVPPGERVHDSEER